jgi:plasmid stabilization system protein ParE
MAPAVFTPEAELDLADQDEWYELHQEEVAERFRVAIEECLLRIKRNPLLGVGYGQEGKRKLQLDTPFSRFSIVYSEESEMILIIAVWASERDPQRLTRR